MGVKEKFDICTYKHKSVSWRIFELECLEKHFGQSVQGDPLGSSTQRVRDCGARYVYWKMHTESTTVGELNHCCNVSQSLANMGIKQINNPNGWLRCHAKERAYMVWERAGIPCPKWFYFTGPRDFVKRCTFGYPMLIRINNSTSGWFSQLCYNEAEVMKALPIVLKGMNYYHDGIPNTGVGRKLIATQFIPTVRPENVILSFRIIVAGNKVVVGYARIGSPDGWIAITNRFEAGMGDLFIKYQKVCQKFCEDNEELIVKSVKSLGLNFQGVDVILDQQNNPYFIEVQPGFSVGYPNRSGWKPPFYNPSKPAALVSFLHANLERLKEETPMYANFWLDKYNMFDKAFKSLKEDLG